MTARANDPQRIVLLSWNPARMESGEFSWEGFDDPVGFLRKVNRSRGASDWWGIGRRLGVPTGFVAMLVRTRLEPRGVVLAGSVVDGRGELVRDGTRQVQLRWDSGINWTTHEPMSLSAVFNQRVARHIGYCLMQSGYLLEGTRAARLLTAWRQYVCWSRDSKRRSRSLVPPVPAGGVVFDEGKLTRRVVNERERSEKVRRALLTRGVRCEACGVSPAPGAPLSVRRVFQVHHREAIALGPRATALSDVCLLCSTCHQLCHSTDRAMSLTCLRRNRVAWLRESRSSGRERLAISTKSPRNHD